MSLTPRLSAAVQKLPGWLTGPASSEPDDPGREIRLGLIVAVAFFGVFLIWSTFARLDAAAFATGHVIVSGQRQVMQHREGGVVMAIHVKEGQRVKKGQVLLELSAADVRAEERSVSAQVITLQAQRARLLAEQLGKPRIAWPAEFATMTGTAKADVAQAIEVQTAQFNARNAAQAAKAAQLREQEVGYQRQIESSVEQERLLEEELEGVRELADKGYAPMTRIRALERSRSQLVGQRGALAASISETRVQILQLDKERKEQAASELRDAEFALSDLLPKETAARDRLSRVRLQAPATGQVVGLQVFTVGGVIQPGQRLLDIVPDKAPLVLELQVSPNDADDLVVGQKTEVRFTGLHERNLPILTGTLTNISADSFADEKTGQRYFTAEATVDAEQIERLKARRGADFELKPGMPAEVLIPLGSRTAWQYLTDPLMSTLWRSFREH